MKKQRLYLFDTTLRDGAQTSGVNFSVSDKLAISTLLDQLGVDYVEGGYPGANPTDTDFFESPPPLKTAILTAFGMTKRTGRSSSNDPGLASLLNSSARAICLVAKSWDYHVKIALGISNEENLLMIRESVGAVMDSGREALIDCEHFFDGYKSNRDYALDCARAAREAGARWIVLCDTNGGTLPEEIEAIVSDVVNHVPGDQLGIHAHNDTEHAVANSLAAVRAGARHIQGTLNGLGERCGNANLITLIANLMLKEPYASRYETGVSSGALRHLTQSSRHFDELLDRVPNCHAPYVGAAAFATKAGIHASALAKDSRTYEHVSPESVGNQRRLLISDQAGRSNLLAEMKRLGIVIEKGDPLLDRLLAEIKTRAAAGYSYEGADASFDLLVRRTLGTLPSYFNVKSFRVLVEHRYNANGHLVTVSEATVKLNVDGKDIISVGEGNGPVHALDIALRKDLDKYQSLVEDIELVDFKVRILNRGTNAITRVLVESRNGHGEHWFTIGLSPNIVDASFQALVDSINYKLFKEAA